MSRNDEGQPFQDILASISDGLTPDWEAAGRAIGPDEQSTLNALHEVADIAAFNRSLQDEPQLSDGLEESQRLGRWGKLLLLEVVGSGSHAEVYRAWDAVLHREVALKLVRGDPSAGGIDALLAEGRAAARIRHPNVVVIHGIDHHDGKVGLWMELVRGTTLEQQVVSRGPCEIAFALRLAADLGSALAAVHEAGILHRDVKPANIVCDADGRFVLADFGLGRQASIPSRALGPSGTPMYMAPELFAGAPATTGSDLYSLGAVLWFALAGRSPFQVGSLAELVAAARAGPSPRLRVLRPDVPTGLADLVEHAMAVDSAQRIGSTRQFVAALDATGASTIKRSRLRSARSFFVLAAGVAGVIALVALVAVMRGPGPERSRPVVEIMTPSTPQISTTAPPASTVPYSVEAVFMRRSADDNRRLRDGDRVQPGDRLSLEFRSSRPAFVYVLNEDERGEHYLLFPQPRFDTHNPVPGDSLLHLPGAIDGRENGWTVTSAGGREHFVVVASLEPVPEIEAELGRLPAASPGRPVEYPRVGGEIVERLRGVGGVAALPPAVGSSPVHSPALERIRALAGRENEVRGIWAREIAFENP